jgi:hypothetical protein
MDFHAARVTAKEHVDETEISLACEIYITIMRKNFQETKTSTQAHTKNGKDPPCSQLITEKKAHRRAERTHYHIRESPQRHSQIK